MKLSSLTALSPIDGRYAAKTESLRPFFSEYALIKYRLHVEIKWLQFLNHKIENLSLSPQAIHFLSLIDENFDEKEAACIKEIEKKTNHDIKAVEYYLKDKMDALPELKIAKEFVHFACTSDDINNLAYALILYQASQSQVLPALEKIKLKLHSMVHDFADKPILSRTHGQAATPSTMGKELANTLHRFNRQYDALNAFTFLGKINGAVGNFNAHHIAYPRLDWPALAREFVEQFGLSFNAYTTQIEPHDSIAEYAHLLFRLDTLLIDLARDCWGYISLGYFSQRKVEGEVGSSTMPHKVNPIDFENAEGNLYVANALWHLFAERLPVSRWQRDLVDSTLLRNLGVAHAHSLIAYQSLLSGLNKLMLNEAYTQADLESHWEVLTEAVQTVMRRYGLPEPYEQLKALSRGESINKKKLHDFIDGLMLPEDVKKQLKNLTPQNYLGFAEHLANLI
ncbi:MAG: adenylosuccinate lyase [Gammaproteobacteria bacterium]|nr:adenylosuccinate lyase [Gammaproteobacteria bacterium]